MTAALRVPPLRPSPVSILRAREAAYRTLHSSTLTGTLDHDSYAYQARIAAHLHNAGHPDVAASDATNILDTLWAAAYTGGTGNTGFGLNTSFDAFSDGTTNSSTTIYAYTTATCGLAFLDGYKVSSNSTYLTRAEACATTLLNDCWGFTNGSEHGVWYSNNSNDQVATTAYYVLNINALTLALLARLKAINGSSFDATKQGNLETLLSTEHNAASTTGAWYYTISSANGLNDVEHHSLMVEGTVWDATADASNATAYLWSLFGTNGSFDPTDTNMMGSINWGPPEALSALALANSVTDAQQLSLALIPTINTNGVSYLATTDTRSIVRYGLGLARYAARVLGDGSLFP